MKILSLAAALLLLASGASAQEAKTVPEIVTFEGHAFAWQDNWRDKDKAKRGPLLVYDVVSAWSGKPTIADCGKFQTKFKGAAWCFASEANLKKFEAATDKDGDNSLAPFAGGRCTAGLSVGMLGARGNPASARVLTDIFGDGILVLHSHEKWWWEFSKEDLKRAMLALSIANGPRIVPNDQMK